MPRSKRLALSRSAPGPELLTRIDRAIMRMRRDIVKPPELCMPMPSLGRSVDFAKVHACMAIAEGTLEGALSDPDGHRVSTVKDVAAFMQLEHSTASRLLGEAEAEGLVVRGTDPQDRRRTTVALTDSGRLVLKDSLAMRSWAMGRLFDEWSEKDLKNLATMLERMAQTLSDRMPDVVCAARERFEPRDK